MEVKHIFTIDKKEIKLTEEEALELYNKLHELYAPKNVFQPVRPFEQPYVPPWVTYTDGAGHPDWLLHPKITCKVQQCQN